MSDLTVLNAIINRLDAIMERLERIEAGLHPSVYRPSVGSAQDELQRALAESETVERG